MNGATLLSQPWALERAALQEIAAAYQARRIDAQLAGSGARRGSASRMGLQNQVAIIPVHGVLMKRPDLFDSFFGAQSMDQITLDLDIAVSEDSVKAIVLDVDSPGGTVDGTQELANRVHAANLKKPVVALAGGTMASAAYWVGSAADSVWISSDTSRVGSIGVLAKHFDMSQMESRIGVKTTEVYAGKYKGHGSQHAPLSKGAKEDLQAQVDYLYSIFVNDVARFRGAAPSDVLSNMADARIFIGGQAITAGLVDGKATLAELTAILGANTMQRRRPVAAQAATATLTTTAKPIDERCKDEWAADARVRAEFGGDFTAFRAWRRLEDSGRVQSLGAKT